MTKRFLLLALTSSLFFSCNDAPKNEAEATTDKEVKKENSQSMAAPDLAEFEFYKILINMPTPLDEFGHMNKDGIPYDKSLLAPLKNGAKHEKESAIALNCGIYLTDMTYLAEFHETNDILSYTAIAYDLAKKIKAADAFDHFVTDKMKSNLGNRDSIQVIIEEGLEAIETELVDTKKLPTATQLLMGSWVETQFILTQSMLAQPEDKIALDLKQHVFEQREHLANLLLLLHEVKDEAGLHDELAKLEQLEASFTKIHEANEVDNTILAEVADEIKIIRTDLLEM